VRLERFGKSSIALARCSAADSGAAIDQSAYEPLFRGASDVLANYRALLNVKKIVPEELAAISESKQKAAPNPKATKPAGEKK
jgi:hypothetical protein